MNSEHKTQSEQLSSIQRIEELQRKIIASYIKNYPGRKPEAGKVAFPIFINHEAEDVSETGESFGITYKQYENDGVLVLWTDETGYTDPQLSLEVLARFAVTVNPEARRLNHNLKQRILADAQRLDSGRITPRQFKTTQDELHSQYKNEIFEVVFSNKDFLLTELEKALQETASHLQVELS